MIEYWCGECEFCGNDLYCDEYGSNVTCFICKEFEEDEDTYDCGCCKCCGCDCDEEYVNEYRVVYLDSFLEYLKEHGIDVDKIDIEVAE